jgi:hypothetical protein
MTGSGAVSIQLMNRLSGVGLVLLSFTALLVVVWGYTQPPLPDEGTGAHIFQLSVAALVPVTIVFLTTADWSQPRRAAWPLAVAAAATVLAFGALYYLEHVYYPARF